MAERSPRNSDYLYFQSEENSPIGQRINPDKNSSSLERVYGIDESPRPWDTRKKLIYGHDSQDPNLFRGSYGTHKLTKVEKEMKPYSKYKKQEN